MSTITTRAGKGSPLTNTELDSNFTNLNTDKYQSGDSMVASELDLSAISASIADTAVDVFVYDTRKDSDGGAWRKRTQHTSWYNETLNTATRGARKEFPAVAVIVAESNQVTIYDGDDPDLPMWMVFNKGGDYYTIYLGRTAGVVTSISMLNGILCVGDAWGSTAHGEAFTLIDFNADYAKHYDLNAQYKHTFPISGRNYTSGGTVVNIGGSGIVNINAVNDMAMTVLPNAPIDPATQLPIPTIAVATDGGVSVIKDDGSVVDITFTGGGNAIQGITLVEDMLYITQPNSTTFGSVSFGKIPSSDVGLNVWRDVAGTSDNYQLYKTLDPNIPSDDITCISEDAKAFGFPQGLVTTDIPTNPSFRKGMTSLITSTYNTGWMNGDIKLATLSDTDATNVTGTELVTNGTFDSDTSGWTVAGSAILSVVSGAMRVNANGSSYGGAYQAVNVEIGKTYVFSVDSGTVTNGGNWIALFRKALGTSTILSQSFTGAGTFSGTFTATQTTYYIQLESNNDSDIIFDVDNVSVRLAEEDRSVNGNGLQVFGTVTKTPVDEV